MRPKKGAGHSAVEATAPEDEDATADEDDKAPVDEDDEAAAADDDDTVKPNGRRFEAKSARTSSATENDGTTAVAGSLGAHSTR